MASFDWLAKLFDNVSNAALIKTNDNLMMLGLICCVRKNFPLWFLGLTKQHVDKSCHPLQLLCPENGLFFFHCSIQMLKMMTVSFCSNNFPRLQQFIIQYIFHISLNTEKKPFFSKRLGFATVAVLLDPLMIFNHLDFCSKLTFITNDDLPQKGIF